MPYICSVLFQYGTVMATALKTQSGQLFSSERTQKKQTESVPEPKRLSKAGQWRRDNPGGIFEYVDWRAVNGEEPERFSRAKQWMQENPGGIITVIDRRAVNR